MEPDKMKCLKILLWPQTSESIDLASDYSLFEFAKQEKEIDWLSLAKEFKKLVNFQIGKGNYRFLNNVRIKNKIHQIADFIMRKFTKTTLTMKLLGIEKKRTIREVS